MASNCPNCGRTLKWYNIKAECPDCGVSIPNYNWEARLEEDNINAEAKFNAFYKFLNILQYSIVGTKLRIARIILSVVPILGLLFPWLTVSSEKDILNFDLLGIFTDGASTIDFFGILFGDIGGIFSAIIAEGFNSPVTYIMLGLVFILLSILTMVIAFFLIFLVFRKPKTNAIWITDIVGIVFALIATALFGITGNKVNGASFTIGTLEFVDASSSLLWGIFIFIALLAVPLVVNILVSKADVKSEDELEKERLERVRIKEEKEEQQRIKKEAERAEAQKRAEEEQAEKVRKAKEALAKKENK